MTAIATTHWAGHHRHHEPRTGKHRAGKLLLGAALMRAMAEGRRRHGGHRGHGPGHGRLGAGPFGRAASAPSAPAGAASARAAATSAPPSCSCSRRSRATATSSCRSSRSAAAASGARAPARSTPRSRSSRTRGSCAATRPPDGAPSSSPTRAAPYLEANREALGVPWDEVGGDVPEGLIELRKLMMQLGMATMQVAQAGDEAQTAEARKVLEDARRSLYRILAGDAGDEPAAD